MALFGFDESTEEGSNQQGGGFISEAGIYDNMYLTDIYHDKGSNETVFIHMEFEDDDGRTMSHRYYDPSNNDKPEQDAAKQMSIFKGLSKAIIGAEKFPACDTYEEFAQKFTEGLKKQRPDFSSIPMRVKVVLKQNDFPKLPSYPKVFEPMDVPKEQSELQMMRYDKTEKTGADNESSGQQEGGLLSGGGSSSEEDPFSV